MPRSKRYLEFWDDSVHISYALYAHLNYIIFHNHIRRNNNNNIKCVIFFREWFCCEEEGVRFRLLEREDVEEEDGGENARYHKMRDGDVM